jgi:translation initiation factor IF-3
MSPGIGENDFATKLKNGQKFLNDGDRVKVTVRFRGREMAHTDIGLVLLRDFAGKCAEIANMDKAPKLEGRNMSMFLSPKPQAPAKKPAKPKAPKAEEAGE